MKLKKCYIKKEIFIFLTRKEVAFFSSLNFINFKY